VSALPETEFKAFSPVMMARREPVPLVAARATSARREAAEASSPTTSIRKVLVTIGMAFLLGLLLNARSIVHDADGMPDGPMRSGTAFAGGIALTLASATGLAWPRDQIDAALGNSTQPVIPPLLASAGTGPQLAVNVPAGEAPLQQIGSLDGGAPLYKTPTLTPIPASVLAAAAHRATATATAMSIAATATATKSPTHTPTAIATPVAWPSPCSPVGPRESCRGPRPTSASSTAPAASPSGLPRCASWHHPGCKPGGATAVPSPHFPPARPTARPTATTIPTATPTAGPPPRVINSRQPLRLLVTGDSLSGYIGPQLVDKASSAGPVQGSVDTHNGTGLTRPDFVDWSLVAQQQVAASHPDAVVVIIGGNDFQNMTLPNGQVFIAGTPAWSREYQRRAEICMRIWAQGGSKRVYWLSMPPARNSSWAFDDHLINQALKAAAADVVGARYLDVLGPVTDHGKYVDYIHWRGQWLLIREPDGVHLNAAGSNIVADEVLAVVRREWHLQ
jgi:hypothetical protein